MTDVIPPGIALPEIAMLVRKLDFESQSSDSRAAALSIMEGMLRAETEEELFERQEAGTVSSKDFILRPFRLLAENVQWKKSSAVLIEQGGFPYYALLTVTDMETGTDVVVDSGAPSVISVLSKLLDMDTDDRPMEKRAFERFRADGGRPLQFVEKPVSAGNVIMLKPVVTEAAKRGKK